MKAMLSALYSLAQGEGAQSDQLERYYARLRLADLAHTRLPCPRCFTEDGQAGRMERAENPDTLRCSRCGRHFWIRLERRRAPRRATG